MQKFVADENKTRQLSRLASYWLRPWPHPTLTIRAPCPLLTEILHTPLYSCYVTGCWLFYDVDLKALYENNTVLRYWWFQGNLVVINLFSFPMILHYTFSRVFLVQSSSLFVCSASDKNNKFKQQRKRTHEAKVALMQVPEHRNIYTVSQKTSPFLFLK